MKILRTIILFVAWMGCITITAQKFVHPGLLHNTEDIERISSLVARRDSVAYLSYEKLLADPKSSADYKVRGPFEIIARDGAFASTKSPSENDALAAYYNALLYAVNRDRSHGAKAMEIIRLYADSLKCITGHDAPLCAGLQGFLFVNACELMRYVPLPQSSSQGKEAETLWTKQDTKSVERMLRNVCVPILNEFVKTPPYTNGNWGIAMNKLRIAMAVFLEDKKMYREALEYFTGTSDFGKKDNGSLPNYLSSTGQCQESGRDQAHVMLGLGCLAEICEVAWHQGIDLYGELENRLLSGYEYTCKANLGFEVPFELWKDKTGKYSQWKVIGEGGMGQWRSVLEIAYNHYVGRKELQMPYTSMALRYVRPEGAGFTCDNPGFGSLLFYRNTPANFLSTIPGMKLILSSDRRDYDPATEPVINMKGAENLTLVRTVDCWPEYWDLKPTGKSNGVYEYKPAGALSRNGFPFEAKSAKTTFIIYGNLDVAKELKYCANQVDRTLEQMKDELTGQIDDTRTITCIAPYDSVWERKDVGSEEWRGIYWNGILAELGKSKDHKVVDELKTAGMQMSHKAIDEKVDTTLSRNVAWRIWGYANQYINDSSTVSLAKAKAVADWYLKKLPDDMIPYWDFNSPAHLKMFRDACSACIAASGLLILYPCLKSGTLEDRKRAEDYRAAAIRMLIELSSDRYQSRAKKPSFLMHSVGDMLTGSELDYSLVMADYYYLEALLKIKQ